MGAGSNPAALGLLFTWTCGTCMLFIQNPSYSITPSAYLTESKRLMGQILLVLPSIEGFIEDRAFSRSYDLAPRPPPPSSPVSKIDRRHRKTEKERQLAAGPGEGVGEEPNHTTARKPDPL